MFKSFQEFKFFQSFRVPIEQKDDVQFTIEVENDLGKFEFIEDGELKDVSVTGIGFETKQTYSVETNLRITLGYKRVRIEVEGQIVRAFGSQEQDGKILYGVELDSDDHKDQKRFIENFISGFTQDRARDCLVDLALSERYKSAQDGFEIFSLMLSLFKDITTFGNQESFVASMLEEITRILNAQRASIFLINPDTNELEAFAALGADKKLLKFDYRKGIAGSVFTTGVPLNIDTKTDKVRFTQDMDGKTGFQTKSILCHPITNREDKVVGVIEILNKRNDYRFSQEDEKTMKVLALIFSSVFHNYNPISEKSLIRRFSTPYDREYAYIGVSKNTNDLRKAMVKLKDVDSPLIITGEHGTGRKLLAQIIHNEGKRGLNKFIVVNCKGVDPSNLEEKIFGKEGQVGALEECQGGTIVFHEVSHLPLNLQEKLYQTLISKKAEAAEISVDIRAIFTTSEDLSSKVKEEGTFNADLYDYAYTSHVIIEPLRNRRKDIPELVSHFLKKECRKQGLLLKEFSDDALQMLIDYDWPENVHELSKAVEKAVLYHPRAHVISKIDKGATPIIDPTRQKMGGLDHIPHAKDFQLPLKDRVSLVEREMIMAEIKRHKGNKSQAAKSMGISREALRKKLIQSDEVMEKIKSGDLSEPPVKQAA
jgi:two-component system response regulator HydG